MSTQIANIKDLVQPKLRGSSVANIGGFYLHCKEAASNVLLRTAPIETRRSAPIANAIYSHIHNYVAPIDLKGDNKVIDIRPYSQRSTEDENRARFPNQFDIEKEENTFSVEVINGVKTLRLSKDVSPHITIATLDSLTVGQTITGSGDVADLTTNRFDYLSGLASVQFGLSGATGVGTILIVTPSVIDLTSLETIASVFGGIKFPDVSRLTDIKIRWGSDASNYYEATVTGPHDRTAFINDVWSIFRGDWSNAATVGSPVVAEIDTFQVVLNYTTGAALANVRLENLTMSKGVPYEVVYYSRFFFQGIDGTYKEVPTADSDVILMNDGENIFLYELMLILIQQLGDEAITQSARWFENQLLGWERSGGEWNRGLYDIYNEQFPDQSMQQTVQYHRF